MNHFNVNNYNNQENQDNGENEEGKKSVIMKNYLEKILKSILIIINNFLIKVNSYQESKRIIEAEINSKLLY